MKLVFSSFCLAGALALSLAASAQATKSSPPAQTAPNGAALPVFTPLPGSAAPKSSSTEKASRGNTKWIKPAEGDAPARPGQKFDSRKVSSAFKNSKGSSAPGNAKTSTAGSMEKARQLQPRSRRKDLEVDQSSFVKVAVDTIIPTKK